MWYFDLLGAHPWRRIVQTFMEATIMKLALIALRLLATTGIAYEACLFC
jgi:hypothetical protein